MTTTAGVTMSIVTVMMNTNTVMKTTAGVTIMTMSTAGAIAATKITVICIRMRNTASWKSTKRMSSV